MNAGVGSAASESGQQHGARQLYSLGLDFVRESVLTDELKKLYENERLAHRYFDSTTPCDLYRGQTRTEARQGLPALYPNPGFTRRDGSVRLPDLRIEERDGKKFVIGCRSIRGDYRGVSTFDRKTLGLPGFRWYKLPKQTDIPVALAVTQDSDFKNGPNHFTIAPKDDMTLELFLIWLNQLSLKMTEDA